MSAPSKACNVKLVKIQSGKRLAITPELTFAPDRVTCLREAKGKGYRATTQVKGLSPEIISVSVDDAFHFCGSQNSHNRYWQGYANPTGSETVALYQNDIAGTWENQYIPNRVSDNKPINGKEAQMIYWWLDKPIVAKKFRNGNGAKGLTVILRERETTARFEAGEQWLTKLNPETLSMLGEVFLKSRVWENYKHGSVRGLIVSSRRWL